ncbi:MAG: hypothetical protein OXG04_29065 [Acidobacteria bacterium]|nr:hypothetical protein [Acidobacteriota bacterium]
MFSWDRPFRCVEQMNHHLLRECAAGYDPKTPSSAWSTGRIRTLGAIGACCSTYVTCPGRRVLILGNHDRDHQALHEAGFTAQHVAAL